MRRPKAGAGGVVLVATVGLTLLAPPMPSTLTRATSSATINANRNRACPQSLTRPSGKQCDECPFASTNQGAASGGSARVFSGCSLTTVAGSGSRGFSRCMVNAGQNSSAGNALGTFYRNSRVLNGDTFRVGITS